MIFHSRNPWTGEIIAEYQSLSDQEIQACLNRVKPAFQHWSSASLAYRSEIIGNLKKILQRDSGILAQYMSEEMGKPISESGAELAKSLLLIDHYAENAPSWLEDRERMARGRKVILRSEPFGGILLIMPWNFPLWQVIRAAVPALFAGNVVLLKHAPNVFRFAEKLAQIFREAGFPEGVFQEFRAGIPQLEAMIAHDAVTAVSLTGSEAAGRSVASLAGKYLKKCVLELGGSDPFIVFPDADLEKAVSIGVVSRMINNGQSCIAAKRFLIHDAIMEEFSGRMARALSDYKPGNPCLETSRLGPLARPDLAETLRRQQSDTIRSGARLLYEMQDSFPESASCFLPVMLSGVLPGMAAFDQETFGPLLCLTSFSSENHVIELANATRYGLGASVHTADNDRAAFVASKLRCGTVAINALMRSDPSLPFGGLGASGYGKEMAEEGMKEFCLQKVLMQEFP